MRLTIAKKARCLIRRRALVTNMIYSRGSHVAHHSTPVAPPPEIKKQICADLPAVCPAYKCGIGSFPWVAMKKCIKHGVEIIENQMVVKYKISVGC